ncbi:glycosyltransferase family 4 protein [Saccharicrinis sp. FJH54]|uniref:glycosyltransferase family 4 protein n=1 Tax=Saccharicrinis sp. FJH54 TaxID=3344665 RepID=UPI0035D44C77
MTKYKVLIVGKEPPPYYGTTVWYETLQKQLWPDDFKMCWFNNNIHKQLSTLGKLSIKKIFLNVQLYFQFFKYLKKNKPDLVMVPISQATVGFLKDSVFVYISSIYSKTILVLHGSNWLNWLSNSSKPVKRYSEHIIRRADSAVVLGENLKFIFEKYLPKDRIFAVPNGINFRITEKTKGKSNANSKLVLTYLGNLQATKGIKEIFKSLEKIDADRIVFKVIGEWRDNETKEFCLDIVNKNHLDVDFKGPLYGEHKYAELATSDLFIFTPKMPEGHPLVILEAMAMGLPIITTDRGAISESVQDGFNGFVLKDPEPDIIARKISFFIDNPLELKKWGENSKSLYNNKFTAKNMVENYSTVFRKILEIK